MTNFSLTRHLRESFLSVFLFESRRYSVSYILVRRPYDMVAELRCFLRTLLLRSSVSMVVWLFLCCNLQILSIWRQKNLVSQPDLRLRISDLSYSLVHISQNSTAVRSGPHQNGFPSMQTTNFAVLFFTEHYIWTSFCNVVCIHVYVFAAIPSF